MSNKLWVDGLGGAQKSAATAVPYEDRWSVFGSASYNVSAVRLSTRGKEMPRRGLRISCHNQSVAFFFFFFHEGINLAEGGERGPCLKLKSACDGIGSYSATTLEKG